MKLLLSTVHFFQKELLCNYFLKEIYIMDKNDKYI